MEIQPSRSWLSSNADSRYLDAFSGSTDPRTATVGKLDNTLDVLSKDANIMTGILTIDVTIP